MRKARQTDGHGRNQGLDVRDYMIEDYIQTVCPRCFSPESSDLADPSTWIDGMLVSHDGKVWLRRFCPVHGESESLYEGNLEFWRARRGWSTPTKQIVPDRDSNSLPFPRGYAHGLTKSHGQHTCILLLNLTSRCNLTCPVCYAGACGTSERPEPSPGEILHTVKTVIERERGKLGVLMLSGGEPTLRTDLTELIEQLVPLNITRIMLNTNGLELANDNGLLDLLEKHRQRVEVYLQFDGFSADTHLKLRGNARLVEAKQRVVSLLNDGRVFFTLVPTVVRGINEHEIGEIIAYGLKHPYCAGLAIQPSYLSGRHSGLDPADRTTPTDLLAQMEQQTAGLLTGHDFIPLPCSHRDCCDIAYLVQGPDDSWRSLVSLIGRDELRNWLHLVGNTTTFDELSPPVMELLKSGALGRVFSNEYGSGSKNLISDVAQVCNCLPRLSKMIGGLGRLLSSPPCACGGSPSHPGERTFRITIKQFMDSHTLNSQRLRQCCVHTGTYEANPRRHQMCWRFLSTWDADFPAAADGGEPAD
jgi:uncharacterized radical SAM superfamily Fe-S cluster-containing enzyme